MKTAEALVETTDTYLSRKLFLLCVGKDLLLSHSRKASLVFSRKDDISALSKGSTTLIAAFWPLFGGCCTADLSLKSLAQVALQSDHTGNLSRTHNVYLERLRNSWYLPLEIPQNRIYGIIYGCPVL